MWQFQISMMKIYKIGEDTIRAMKVLILLQLLGFLAWKVLSLFCFILHSLVNKVIFLVWVERMEASEASRFSETFKWELTQANSVIAFRWYFFKKSIIFETSRLIFSRLIQICELFNCLDRNLYLSVICIFKLKWLLPLSYEYIWICTFELWTFTDFRFDFWFSICLGLRGHKHL